MTRVARGRPWGARYADWSGSTINDGFDYTHGRNLWQEKLDYTNNWLAAHISDAQARPLPAWQAPEPAACMHAPPLSDLIAFAFVGTSGERSACLTSCVSYWRRCGDKSTARPCARWHHLHACAGDPDVARWQQRDNRSASGLSLALQVG